MTRRLILLFCSLFLICSPLFLSSEPVHSAPTVKPSDAVVLQKHEVHEPKISPLSRSVSEQFTGSDHSLTGDIGLPKLEAYDPSLIADGYFTGKTVGYKVGKAIKDYACSNFYLNCFVER